MCEQTSPEDLLNAARAGSASDRGALLELYRRYLKLLARVEIGHGLQAKIDASDLAQEALLEAHRHFDAFRGDGERQFVAWLRKIMAATLSNAMRRYMGTQCRDIRLEQELRCRLDQSSQMLGEGIWDHRSSPSQQAARREQAVLLANALEQLPEDYRKVLVLRHLEGLPFADVAQRMGRSLDSVEKLWVRGLARLRQAMGAMS
ncbi:MAG: sigma-70 family RNA polymerase sigma factor [Planctomycetota bacterium]